jgi:lipopolysaccharide transport system permease protein
MLTSIKELYSRRELLALWSWREIRARYNKTSLGLAWAVFQPVALSLTYWLLALIVKLPSDGLPYPIFVYVAQLPWSFFTRGLSFAVPSIVSNMNLVTKIYVPRVIFPIAAIATCLVDFASGTVVLVVLMVLYHIPLHITLPFVFVLLAIQLTFMIGLSLIGASLNVITRDIGQMLPLVLQIAAYACPIIYSLTQVPDRLRPILLLNPMVVVIDGYRQVILKGTLPPAEWVALAAAISVATLMIGVSVFRHLEDRFADVI